MRRASSTFLVHLSPHFKLARSLVSNLHLLINPKTQSINPSLRTNFNTLPDETPISSSQRKIEDNYRLKEAFETTKSIPKMLSAFKDMEASFSERELGFASLDLGIKLDHEGKDPEKTLSFALKALNSFDNMDEKPSLYIALTLQLLGCACYKLKRYDDGVGYLIRANRVLGRIEKEGSFSNGDIRPILLAVETRLANTNKAMGRRTEVVGNLRKCLELKELMSGEDSKELGDANRELADAYVAVLDFKCALPFCIKALEIHMAHFGQNSVEVAYDRQKLAVIYAGTKDDDKALLQIQLSQKVLKDCGLCSDLFKTGIICSRIQFTSGRYQEAVNTLKFIAQQTEKGSFDRALVFVSMGRAMCGQGKYLDAKKCMEIACSVLAKKETTSPLEVSKEYMGISEVYGAMNEFESAIRLLKKALSMLEKLPQEKFWEGFVCAKIGLILSLTGKVKEAVPYLEGAAERMKGCSEEGPWFVYNLLGAAYMKLDRPQSAAQMFAFAKDSLDVSLGPAHVKTIEACQNLSKAYGTMKSYQLAIKFQEKVIEAWESHDSSAHDKLQEANRVLEQLKKKAHEVSTLPLPYRYETASIKGA